jgi:hypothetical protein
VFTRARHTHGAASEVSGVNLVWDIIFPKACDVFLSPMGKYRDNTLNQATTTSPLLAAFQSFGNIQYELLRASLNKRKTRKQLNK